MTLYEMDRPDPDDRMVTIDFPACSVVMNCGHNECQVVTSQWNNPTGWDSIEEIDAKIRLKVTGAALEWIEY
ncbi:MAG: hypothetical protein ACETWC_07020 [Acidobacteriota bacterium]